MLQDNNFFVERPERFRELESLPVLALHLVVGFDLLNGDDLVDALLAGDGYVVDVHLDRGRGGDDGVGGGRGMMNVGNSRGRKDYKKLLALHFF